MATSGTTSFAPDIATLIEEAFDLAGYEGRSGYEYRDRCAFDELPDG